ncbi:MAG: hypothetical protein J4F37_12805 [Acidobacteria bacterium]|nr:hypothetical protein [Acidobacteriota bacterium]
MSGDTKAIVGTIVGTGLLVAGLLSAQISSGHASLNTRIDDLSDALNGRIDDLNGRIDDLNGRLDGLSARVDRIEARLVRFDERLRGVEIAFAKVDQRLETLERTLLPPASPPPD